MGPKNSFSHIERHENKEKTSVLLWSQNSLTNPNSVVINWRKKIIILPGFIVTSWLGVSKPTKIQPQGKQRARRLADVKLTDVRKYFTMPLFALANAYVVMLINL
jgi:hypothetical protein